MLKFYRLMILLLAGILLVLPARQQLTFCLSQRSWFAGGLFWPRRKPGGAGDPAV
jgi:hypothetical protein